MRNLLDSDEHVVVERRASPTAVPQKRKLGDVDTPRRSGESTPRLVDVPASDSHTPNHIPLLPSNHILKPPVFVPTSEPGYYSTNDVPSSRFYRYLPAVLSPTYDPSIDELPYYQTGESTPAACVRVSWEDRSPFIRVTEDGLGLVGDKGFRSARLNVPVREGQWYIEIEVLHGDGDSDPLPESSGAGSGGAHIRLGWARREASLNGPAGLDGYSYGYRDKTGEKVTLSRPRPYGKSFRTGDVVGLYISLPSRRQANPKDLDDPARVVPKRTPIQYRGSSFFEASEYSHSKEMDTLADNPEAFYQTLAETVSTSTTDNVTRPAGPGARPSGAHVKNTPGSAPSRKRPGGAPSPDKTLAEKKNVLRPLPTLEHSAISFFINGEDQGVAFEDVFSYLQLPQPKARTRGGGTGRTTTLKERENHFDDGTLGYYPFISLFGNAKVRINAGPDFKCPPPIDYNPHPIPPSDRSSTSGGSQAWRPLSERYPEYLAELRAIDAKEEADLRAMKLAAAVDAKLSSDKDKVKQEKIASRAKEKEKAKAKVSMSMSPAPVVGDTQQRDFLELPPLPSRHSSNSAIGASIVHTPSPLSMPISTSLPTSTQYLAPAGGDMTPEQNAIRLMYEQYRSM